MQTKFETISGKFVPNPEALADDALELVAARFKALSEPTRLRLLAALKGGERNVTELVEFTGTSQANISRQLLVLTQAGILGRRKSGLHTFYFVADKAIYDLCELVCGSVQDRLARQNRAFGK